MTDPTSSFGDGGTADKWKRRGLFGMAAALVAGFMARVAEQPVEAGTDGDVVLGASNTESTTTLIQHTGSTGPALRASCMAPTNGRGLEGVGSQVGVYGVGSPSIPGSGSTGVLGVADVGASYGVQGLDHSGSTSGIGVYGASVSGWGSIGSSNSGVGVFGQVAAPGGPGSVAVWGQNYGQQSGLGAGTGGFGVLGVSANGHGVYGAASTVGAGGVVGASNGIAGAWAMICFGPAIVEGDFTVVGGAKSAAVRCPDGTYRRLYCVESPESWFEDFGKGQLECGQAEVRFDPEFAAVVNLDDYHVFLTSYDDQLLHVAQQTSGGFTVRAREAAANARFSWRVVARRKDIDATRFQTVTVPPQPVVPRLREPITDGRR